LSAVADIQQLTINLTVGATPQDSGLFHKKPQSRSMQEAMASDPSVMVDMMKKNLTGIVPQVCLKLSDTTRCEVYEIEGGLYQQNLQLD
jgi:hypothetical protein